jgi:hypothetical protein
VGEGVYLGLNTMHNNLKGRIFPVAAIFLQPPALPFILKSPLLISRFSHVVAAPSAAQRWLANLCFAGIWHFLRISANAHVAAVPSRSRWFGVNGV